MNDKLKMQDYELQQPEKSFSDHKNRTTGPNISAQLQISVAVNNQNKNDSNQSTCQKGCLLYFRLAHRLLMFSHQVKHRHLR